MMEIDNLEQFLAVAEHLHFGRASRKCRLSVSALSRAIQRLEADLGTTLFERERHRVRLTPQGKLFEAFARESLSRFQDLKSSLRRPQDNLVGSVRVFASVTACQSFLPDVLSRFRQSHEHVQIQLETGYAADALHMLQDSTVDLAIAALPERLPAWLSAHVLVRTPLRFVAPASLCAVKRQVQRRQIPWSEVPIILPPFGLSRKSADSWFRRRRCKPQIYGEVLGHEAILSLVSLGCGIGIVPELVVDKSALRGKVELLEVTPRLPVLDVAACVRKTRLLSPVIQALWDSFNVPVQPA